MMDEMMDSKAEVSPELQTKLDELLALVHSQSDIDAIRTALMDEEKEISGGTEETEEAPEEEVKEGPPKKKFPVKEFSDEEMPK